MCFSDNRMKKYLPLLSFPMIKNLQIATADNGMEFIIYTNMFVKMIYIIDF